MANLLTDSYGRTIRDLRISLTDRCNFRCFYCRPVMEGNFAGKEKILTYEEIVKVAEIFVSLGIEKIRLTGGEPLLRKEVETVIADLSKLKPGLKDIALTTNGFSLAKRARDLKEAGLDRITISLDSLKRENFKEITGADKLDEVLFAIDCAKKENLQPLKVNVVVIKNYNDDEIVDFARFAREKEISVRFIEFMPLDSGHEWKRDVLVSSKEIRQKIEKVYPLKLKEKFRGSSTAWNFGFADGVKGEIGIIAPVTEMFCGACSRIRLTADGQIRTCLFSNTEYDLREVLRSGASRDEIVQFIKQTVLKKEKRHHINDADFVKPERTMSLIGG